MNNALRRQVIRIHGIDHGMPLMLTTRQTKQPAQEKTKTSRHVSTIDLFLTTALPTAQLLGIWTVANTITVCQTANPLWNST